MPEDFGQVLKTWEEGKKSPESKKPHWSQSLDHYGTGQPKDNATPGPRIFTKDEKKRFPIQDEADLHGLTGEQALKVLAEFIKTCRQRRLRKVRVIHGRGLHSGKEPVLRPLVRSWVDRNHGLTWESCNSEDGGPGALWIWID